MKEKLIIRNFGPIKSVELDLGRFTVLIGEQATGKSTVAKVLAVCRYFSYIVSPDSYAFVNGLAAWGLRGYDKEGCFIYYECEHYSLTVEEDWKLKYEYDTVNEEPFEVKELSLCTKLIPKSQTFKNALIDFANVIKGKREYELFYDVPKAFFKQYITHFMDYPLYFPVERGLQSIFLLGQERVRNLSDLLHVYFSKADKIFRNFKTETEIEPLDLIYVNTYGTGLVRKKMKRPFIR